MINDEQLSELEAKARAAGSINWSTYMDIFETLSVRTKERKLVCKPDTWNNAEFIAAANPATVLELVADLRRANAVCKALTKAHLLEAYNGLGIPEAWAVVWKFHDKWSGVE